MAPASSSSPALLFSIDAHKGAVHTAVYNTGSSYILSGGADRVIRLTNAKSGLEVKQYGGHGYEVLGIACTHDNTRFASCGGDRSVFLWDVTSGDIVRRLSGHMGKINTVAWNADSSVLASGSFDTTVRLWDIKSQNRAPLQVLEDARDSITSIRIHEHLVCTGSVDGKVRTYDLRMGRLQTDLFDQPVTSLALTADASLLLVSTLDSTHRLLDLSNGTVVQTFSGHKNTSYRSQSCIGAREETVICGDEEGKVWRWDLESGAPIGSPFKAHERAILWTAHHPKEQQLVTAGADGSVKVWGAAAK
ncbi:WD40 repeat domain-containing protein [Rhodotorula paludigena]|uniref:WD40 repeat domain-containing protein n=1 Tax=Rhodotorula paludigena TaxID=86838 RepID=UPI00316CFC07